jgi:hypothetical protein
VTKRALPYFSFIFLTKTIRRITARRFSLWGVYKTNQRANRLDNHLHSRLARPTTLRLYQHRAPTVRMLIPYIGPPATPRTTLRQSRITGGPAHRPPYLRLYFPLVNTRPVPLCQALLPPFVHDIMPRTGHTPLSFHSLSSATQLANPCIWGALLTEPLSHGALLRQAS